jgi:integrase
MAGEMVGVDAKGKKPKGRHPDKRLSAVTVRQRSTPGRYCDGGGLYLVVDETGAKRWQLRAVIAGKRTEIGLGGLTTVSLAEARDEALRLRKLVRGGGNPLLERRRARRSTLTFKAAAEAVHKEHAKAFKNAKHATQWLQSLENDVFSSIGAKLIDQIDTPDVLKVLTPIWTKKPETARRLKQRIKVVLEWAKASGYRTGDNPTDAITKVLPKHRAEKVHHAALAYPQVPAFVHELRQIDASVITKVAFEFLILTAARTSEVIGARWDEFDIEAKLWVVPAARIKAGREHHVPLCSGCLDLLDIAKPLGDGGPYVFPGRSLLKPLSNMVFLKALERMRRDDVTAHGFRSAFRDWAAERTNFPRAVCEAALAHAIKDKVEAAYLRTSFLEQRRELMTTWAAFATSTPATVVTLRA